MFRHIPSIHICNYNRLNYGKYTYIRAFCYITCSCQSRPSINNLLDYANNLALKTLYPSPPAPFDYLGVVHLSLAVFSLFFLCVCSVTWSRPTFCKLFFLSLLLMNLLARAKTLDSSLCPKQELMAAGGRVFRLSFC